ncbi:pseudouridine synthase [Paracoccus shanxieyensis]|uniref:Pseudouridine synthase n=1 Tax=Paracoccus shanxieyensis TaxID=2675752 RepID=A0A6L6IYC7_9RHOB|nr:pseudouridine synthase [Paracoccus shanxieyensis]MTH64621.1 pseudouridine synthase [Paracoccus shanxieyensis]MTH87765.1 pseudouridine synthase [Paracoccus shanxieyensis]
MTDTPEDSPKTDATDDAAKPKNLDRIAKVIARAGLASRRDAERMIVEGRVKVNGKKIDSPALDVTPDDKISVDGKPLDEPQETRLWMYYKPLGLVTSESDEKGRQTVFDALPRDLPRVMSVGRLDLNSEGLLLLTNDGELKRRLELPTTGWLRRYRVRVNGQPNDLTFAPLRRGVTIDGEEFAPMEIALDSQQGANAWLTVGIREGKNREIRRAMSHIGLIVNRLIRIGYGPFKLTGMEENEVREIKRKVLRDQLGGLLTGEEVEAKPRDFRERGAGRRDEDGDRRPFARREDGDRKPFARREDGDRKPYARREDGDRKPYEKREGGDRKPYGDRPQSDRRPFAKREDGDKPFARRDGKPFAKREDGDRKPYARREDGDRKPYEKREGGDRKPYGDRPQSDRRPFAKREDGDKPFARRDGKPFAKREDGDRKPFARREDGDRKPYEKREGGDRKPYGDRPQSDRRPFAKREDGDKPFGRRDGKPFAKREDGDRKPYARREDGDRKPYEKREGGDRKPYGKPEGQSGKPGGKPYGKPGGKPGGFAGKGGPRTTDRTPGKGTRPEGKGPRRG